MTAHYRSFLDFSREALEGARSTRANMIKKIAQHTLPTPEQLSKHTPGKTYQELSEAMADDLDTVRVLTLMHTHLNNLPESLFDILLFDQHITKIDLLRGALAAQTHATQKAPEEVVSLADQRIQAKKDKDFALADEIREKIRSHGREVKDTADGYLLEKL